MATRTPIKLVDLGSGQGALKEFEAGDTLPAAVMPNTDSITEGATNLYFTQARVRTTPLTGLSVTNSAIVATDTVLAGLGKAQGQINAKAASGANSDITSLSGLTTALSVAQGGTGQTTVAAYLASLITAGAYAKSNAVGTVSQSGGVPTGAIIEQGSNSNGDFVKLADGTMIAWVSGIALAFSNSANLSATWTFPATFAAAPMVLPQIDLTNFANKIYSTTKEVYKRNTTTSSVGVGLASNSLWVSGDQSLVTIGAAAVGRWF